jgi:predicted alpha/beta-hydrolase family hydrolase
VIETVHAKVTSARHALFIGGKSMGGRIATQVAAADPELRLFGLVLLGYPLHPPGKPTERRDKHLPAIGRPMLFVQGTRDTFGTPEELAPVLVTMQPPPAVYVVGKGDHSFKLPRKDPVAQAAVYADVQRAIVDFIRASTP